MKSIREVATLAFKRRRIHVRSGFLALWCLEAVVPALALTAALAESVGGEGAFARLVGLALESSVFGDTAEQASIWLGDIVARMTLGTLGAFGIASSLFVTYQLYAAALFDINELFEAEGERTWLQHVLWFFAFCVWLGALLLGSTVASVWLLGSGRYFVLPVTWWVTASVLMAGIWGLGRETPPVKSLIVGAAVGGAWMEFLKGFFYVYSTSQSGTDALATTYRQLAFLPLTFLWMHLVWFSFLLAALVSQWHAELGHEE